MVCSYCGSNTSVVNSRLQKRFNQVWRRRKCNKCAAILTTHEAIDLGNRTFILLDKGKSCGEFTRDRLFLSIYRSLAHRKSAIADATALTSTVIGKLIARTNNGVIEKENITETALEVLKNFDHPAEVHYRAFYAD